MGKNIEKDKYRDENRKLKQQKKEIKYKIHETYGINRIK